MQDERMKQALRDHWRRENRKLWRSLLLFALCGVVGWLGGKPENSLLLQLWAVAVTFFAGGFFFLYQDADEKARKHEEDIRQHLASHD